MQIVVIDSQGGGFGRSLIEKLRAAGCQEEIIAVGTNAMATSAMLKAGADAGATGENAVVVNARHAQLIAGPIGIVLADSLMGECSTAMASAVAQSPAQKVLIPVSTCGVMVAGACGLSMSQRLAEAVRLLQEQLG